MLLKMVLNLTAVNKFKYKVPNTPKNWKNTVRDWRIAHLCELNRKRSAGDTSDVLMPVQKWSTIPSRRGTRNLRSDHAVVNTAIGVAVGEGIVKGHDPSLLSCNEGPIELTRG